MKRALLIVLCVLLLDVMMAISEASAEKSGTCGENLTWRQDDNGVLTISGSGKMDNYSWGGPWGTWSSFTASEVIIEQGVTNIGEFAFENCSSLLEISIPDSVTEIGNFAFSGCTGLMSVSIPQNVEVIGENALTGCSSLKSIDVSSDNTNYSSIDGVLLNKAKTEIIKCPIKKEGSFTIPKSVIKIRDSAFYSCVGLTSITIPDGVVYIEKHGFDGCSGLTKISIPDSVTSVGDHAFAGCDGLKDITLPNKITEISKFCFAGCKNLVSIAIPNKVTKIGDQAFQYCSELTNVMLSNDLISIGEDAFFKCRKLADIIIPDNVIEIGYRAFYGCDSLINITIPKGVSSLSNELFSCCSNLLSVNLPGGLTKIGKSTFFDCSKLSNISIPNSVVSIGDYAFEGCNQLNRVMIPNSVTTIGNSAFSRCTSLTNISIPNGVTKIQDGVFDQCISLTSVTIPESVTSIGELVFGNANSELTIYCYTGSAADKYAETEKLKVVYLDSSPVIKPFFTEQPESISVKVGDKATFSVTATGADTYQWYMRNAGGCWTEISEKGTSATYNLTAPEHFHGSQFRCKATNNGGSVYSNIATLTVTSESEEIDPEGDIEEEGTCGENLNWTLYKNGTVIISGAGGMWDMYDLDTNSGKNPWGCLISKAIIRSGVVNISRYTFDGCKYLADIVIPNSVVHIDEGAFWGCQSLTSVNIPDSVTFIVGYTFADCANLKRVTILNDQTELAEKAFFRCDKDLTIYCNANSRAYEYAIKNNIKVFLVDVPFDGSHCTNCGSVNIAVIPSIEPTTIEAGLTEGKCCGDCGTILVSQEFISKKTEGEAGDDGNDVQNDEPVDKVEAFVTRCYKLILNREADESGLQGWSEALKNKAATAAQIIDGFVRSPEYVLRNLSNSESVDILYNTMLDRAADAGGKAGWVDALNKGYTLQNIIDGFCGSPEFKAICDSFGIEPGSVGAAAPADMSTPRGKIEAFVKRCYSLILSRDADQGGLQGWSDALEQRTAAAAQIIDGFVRSEEYTNRNLGAGESVDILYQTMLGRAADSAGRAGWVDALGQGYTLQHIINGFCGSAEFTAICENYGIVAGNVAVSGAMVKREAITPEGDEAEAPVIYRGYSSEFINEEKIRTFVEHCYKAVFGREGDAEGIENYTKAILDGKKTPKKVAYEFIFSPEFQSNLPGNEAFIRILYKLYFGREADAEGLTGWVQMLESGTSLEDIVNGFAGSAEFKAVVNMMKQ